MEFAAIALGIGIDTACSRQAMPTVVTERSRSAGYAYADEICSFKIAKKQRRLE